jgi:hypothetical protein
MKMREMVLQIKTLFQKRASRRIATGAVLTVCITLGIIFFSMKDSLSVNPTVTHSVYTIPEHATMYVEILDPQEFYSGFEKSSFGKSVLSSKAWGKLTGTPEFQKLTNLLYFIELKAGTTIQYKDLPSFFGGSVGIARMEDHSYLVVAKTNLKSRLAISLAAAFKGDKVPAIPDKKKDKPIKDEKEKPRKLEGVTDESYQDLFAESSLPYGNLTLTRITATEGYIYLVLLDGYLFVSDSESTIKEALFIAAKPESASLRSAKGMKEAVTAFEKGGQIFVYLNSKLSAASPLLTNTIPADGTAIVLYADPAKTLSGDIFAIGSSTKGSAETGDPVAWEKIIPQDQAAVIYSSERGINEAINRIGSLGKNWETLYQGSDSYLVGAGIDRKDYFGKQKGSAVIFHGFETFNKRIYPHFAIGFKSEKQNNLFLKALFKAQRETTQNFQGVSYTALTGGGFYAPSGFYGAAGIISSSRFNLEKYISTSKGNRPALGDDPSFAFLGAFAKAPHHIVISIPRTIEALRSFYMFGAERTNGYGQTTVDRDIMALADPIRQYETLHIAMGLDRIHTGKIVLTEARQGK